MAQDDKKSSVDLSLILNQGDDLVKGMTVTVSGRTVIIKVELSEALPDHTALTVKLPRKYEGSWPDMFAFIERHGWVKVDSWTKLYSLFPSQSGRMVV